MSGHIAGLAWVRCAEHPKSVLIDPPMRAVLSAMGWFARTGSDPRCHASLPTLADLTGYARSTVAEAIQRLAAMDLIDLAEHRPGVRKEWRLIALATDDPSGSRMGSEKPHPSGSRTNPSGSRTGTRPGAGQTRPGAGPESVGDPKESPKETSAGAARSGAGAPAHSTSTPAEVVPPPGGWRLDQPPQYAADPDTDPDTPTPEYEAWTQWAARHATPEQITYARHWAASWRGDEENLPDDWDEDESAKGVFPDEMNSGMSYTFVDVAGAIADLHGFRMDP